MEPHAPETSTKGGIVIPKGSAEERNMGVVLRVGPACESVAAGDTVLYSHYAGHEFEYCNDKYLLLHEEDIHAVEE